MGYTVGVGRMLLVKGADIKTALESIEKRMELMVKNEEVSIRIWKEGG
jgi:hypothetical protein